MARKRRDPSPPPPPQQSSSGEESDSDAEVEAEGSPRAGATPMPPQNPQPHPFAAAADDVEEESDQDADAPASPMRSGSKPAAALNSDADEEEDGGSVESDPDVPAPKKAAPTKKKAKTATQVKKGSAPGPSGKAKTVEQGKKRPAPDPAPSGKSKKAKAEAGKVAPEATSTGKSNKAKAEQKGTPGPTASSKAKSPVGKLEESGASHVHRNWSKHDNILILETLAGHMKKKAELMDAGDLRAAIGDRLHRKNCSKTEMYDKIRSLNRRYNNIAGGGNVPSGEYELRMYQLLDAIWGQEAKETIAAAAVSQKDSSVTKSKKGQASKEKVDGNAKGRTVEEVANYTIDTQKGKEGTSTATQNGDALANGKGETVDKEASTGNQNGCTGTEEETQEDDAEREASVQGTHRSFDDLEKLPQLVGCVERIKAKHLCEEARMMASGFISDDKAQALESAMIAQKKADAETLAQRWEIQAKLIGLLVPLMDDV